MTPHLVVETTNDEVEVPRQYEDNGKIVLNIGPMAIKALTLGNEDLTFNARFDGQPMDVYIPVKHVLAIYTRENGQGMMFSDDQNPSPPEPEDSPPPRPQLKVVK